MSVVVVVAALLAGAPSPTVPDAWTAPHARADESADRSGVFVAAQLITAIDAIVAATEPQTVLPAFRLDRADLGGGFVYDDIAALVVRAETIRSAAPQSAFGIDGDSLLPRLKLGYGALRPRFEVASVPVVVEGRAGLVPSPWLSRLEPRITSRGLAPLPSEALGLFDSSDLGASLDVSAFDIVGIGVTVDNGEGKNEEERNAGKNVSVVGSVAVPVVALDDDDVVVGGVVLYKDGSRGAGAVRDHRAAAAVFVDHARAHLVVEGVYGFGQDARAEVEPAVVDVAVDVTLWPNVIGVIGRYALHTDDTHVADAWSHQAALAVFSDVGVDLTDSRLLRRLRVFAGVSGDVVGAGAGPFVGVPAAGNAWQLFAAVEINGASDVWNPFPMLPPKEASP